MMRFRNLFFMVLMVSLLFFGCRRIPVGLETRSEHQIILRLADTLNANAPSTMRCIEFARLVEERTNGRIQVRIFDDGELGDECSVIEQVQFGGIDIARVKSVLLSEYIKKYHLLFLPYVYRDEEHMWKVLNGKIGVDFSNELLKEKFVMLCWYEVGTCGFYTTKRPIRSLADFKGLKLGIPRSRPMMDYISNLGAIPVTLETPTAFGELQNRTIDGAESSLVLYYLLKTYEVARFYTIDTQSCIPEILVASRVSLMHLSKQDQEIIANAALESFNFERRVLQMKQRQAMAALRKDGVTITSFDKDQNQQMRRNMASIFEHFSLEEQRLLEQILELY